MHRRDLLGMAPLALLAGTVRANDAHTDAAHTDAARADAPPRRGRLPRFEHLYDCDVTLSAIQEVGKVTDGTRRIIPITGGQFAGDRMRGVVLPGGADWNLHRSDGATVVEADYYLKTDDGTLIRISNKGVGLAAPGETPPTGDGEHFILFTTPSFVAPEGRYAWLNQSTFVGTLNVRTGAKDSVLIRVFQVI